MHDISEKFTNSKTCRILLSYKKVDDVINAYEFPVKHVASVPIKMHGSGSQFTCNIFTRIGKPGPGAKKKCQGVPCDPLFWDSIQTCMNGPDAVSSSVNGHVDKFFKSKRKRPRKDIKYTE